MVPTAGPIVKTEPPEEAPIPEQIGEAETGVVGEVLTSASITKVELPEDPTATDQVYFHEGGELAAEDFEQELAVIPEIVISLTDKVSIEDIKVGDPTVRGREKAIDCAKEELGRIRIRHV
ncbi:hypothetical protein PF008_g29124 [Phytophthora fragariae]|uniref:Uncharacterized protein n=1 Tax=Phytophthora fragariae TaxID=53985 RepID=A0A6G0Q9D9_9STRA|nr:hypothetical protein PF008_g29124 [Phytophthora fragariae]